MIFKNENVNYNNESYNGNQVVMDDQKHLISTAIQQQHLNGASIQGIENVIGGTKLIVSRGNPTPNNLSNCSLTTVNGYKNDNVQELNNQIRNFTNGSVVTSKADDRLLGNIQSNTKYNGHQITSPSVMNIADLGKVKIPIPKITKPPPPKVSKNNNGTKPLVLTSQQFAQLTQSGILKVTPTQTSTTYNSNNVSLSQNKLSSDLEINAPKIANSTETSTVSPIVIKTEPIIVSSNQLNGNGSKPLKSIQIPQVSTVPSKTTAATSNGITLQAVAVNNSNVDVSKDIILETNRIIIIQ